MTADPAISRPDRGRSLSYGWVIVVMAAWAMVATLPGRTHGLGMITERLLADERFGIDRVSYSNLNLWATLLGALFCLPCGWLIDRYGLRINLTLTVAALAGAVYGMTRVTDAQTLFLAILLTRGFGQSALSVISISMVGKWFPGRSSLPMAVYSLLLSLGFAYSAQLAKPYAGDDWRVLWGGIGLLLAASVPVCLLFTRDPAPLSPQDGSAACCGAASSGAAVGLTLRQAAATQTFWVFGLAISLIALIGSGTSLFNESVLNQQGFSTDVYYDLITLTGTVSLLTKLPIGWLGGRIALNRLLTAGLVLQSLCMLLLPHIHTMWGIRFYGAGMGVAGTITTVLFFTIWGQAFGRAHLGQIQSLAQMMTVVASALGPRLFADCFQRWGNYAGVFQMLSALAALLAVWSWFVKVPRPEDVERKPMLLKTSLPVDAPFQEVT